MSASDPFVGIGDLQEDLGMFEAAAHAEAVELPAVSVRTVLVALDDSNQDATARAVGKVVASALGAEVSEQRGLTTAQALRDAKKALSADLLVLPVPFGSDIGELREESLGVVVDQLLATCLPLLAIRQPQEVAAVQALLRRVYVPLSPVHERGAMALAWACRLLGHAGTLRILEFPDAALRQEARALSAGGDSRAAVQRVLTRHYAGSVATVQRLSVAAGFQVHVHSQTGRLVDETIQAVAQAAGLVIIDGAADRRSDAFHHAADLILASSGPVLVV